MATLDVHLVTPDHEVWSGEASFVVARAGDGDVGVLPGHEPMLSVLLPGEFKIEANGAVVQTGTINGGFLSVGPAVDGVTRVDLLAEHVTNEA